MAISTRGRYGIRALLAIVKANRPLSTARISKLEDISLPYLEQICNRLKRAGIVLSRRGAQGGYILARPANKISVGEVIAILDGPVKFGQCHNPEHEEECEKRDICASRRFWSELESDVNSKLYRTTLQDLKDLEAGLIEQVQAKSNEPNLLRS
ncbi:MAG: Rrf2 family transcriptional regulator [candidate division Zixibacteria bacterium]|nr:Rrf2 family transcriptional regulator [candidate division Zixibacteria bacterium]